MTPTWVAEEQVVFVHPDGSRRAGRIAVGAPAYVSPHEAQCAVALDGFQERIPRISGGSSLQALLLATRFLGWRLHDFVSKGGRVLDPSDDSDLELKSMFGALLRHPDSSGAAE